MVIFFIDVQTGGQSSKVMWVENETRRHRTANITRSIRRPHRFIPIEADMMNTTAYEHDNADSYSREILKTDG